MAITLGDIGQPPLQTIKVASSVIIDNHTVPMTIVELVVASLVKFGMYLHYINTQILCMYIYICVCMIEFMLYCL